MKSTTCCSNSTLIRFIDDICWIVFTFTCARLANGLHGLRIRRKSRTEATEFTESLPENFQSFCSISFHGSITRDEGKIVLDRLPGEHPVKGISVPIQKENMMKGRSDLNG